MTAGAAAFAPRSGDIDGLLSTCIDVAQGKMVFPFLDVRELQQGPIQQLSRRERVRLEVLSKGLTNRELAKELNISQVAVYKLEEGQIKSISQEVTQILEEKVSRVDRGE